MGFVADENGVMGDDRTNRRDGLPCRTGGQTPESPRRGSGDDTSAGRTGRPVGRKGIAPETIEERDPPQHAVTTHGASGTQFDVHATGL
jgi:hypothetical protein